MIKINKRRPIPSARGGSGRSIYPWRAMKVGDSFFVKGKHQSSMKSASYSHKPKQFTTRKEGDGVRVWRTK